MAGIKNLKGINSYGFPPLGRIRLGHMEKNKKGNGEHPVEDDHFVLRDAQDLIPAYGTEPKTLLVYLPYPEQERNYRTAYELYKSGGLYCQGDGDVINWAVDPTGKTGQVVIKDGIVRTPYTEETGEMFQIGDHVPCRGDGDDAVFPRCKECGANGSLYIMVRDPKEPLRFVNNRMGYYQINSGSISNIVDLTQQLNGLPEGRHGLAGIPMILRRVPGTRSIPGDDGKRVKVVKYFLQLEVDPMWAQYGALAMAASAMGLPASDLVNLPELAVSTDPAVEPKGLPPITIGDSDDIDVEMAGKIADLEAAKDNVPANMGEFHEILMSFYGTAYDSKATIMELRQRKGLGRTDELKLDTVTWQMACDLMIENLGG